MIEGTFVNLRAIEREDLPTLLAWRNSAALRQNFREYRELNYENQIKWFENTVVPASSTLMFGIEKKEAGNLIGACGLCGIDFKNRISEISIYIGIDSLYIDDMYAPEAIKLLLTFGFHELSLNKIWCEIFSSDEKKQKLISEAGFSLEGRHRQTHFTKGRWEDSLFYGFLAEEL